jgi:hypothetical protein
MLYCHGERPKEVRPSLQAKEIATSFSSTV